MTEVVPAGTLMTSSCGVTHTCRLRKFSILLYLQMVVFIDIIQPSHGRSNPSPPPTSFFMHLACPGTRGRSCRHVLVGRVCSCRSVSAEARVHPAALLEKAPKLGRAHDPSNKTPCGHAALVHAGGCALTFSLFFFFLRARACVRASVRPSVRYFLFPFSFFLGSRLVFTEALSQIYTRYSSIYIFDCTVSGWQAYGM